MRKVVKIHQFDSEIYPFKIWICIVNRGDVDDNIFEQFIGIDGEEIDYKGRRDRKRATTFWLKHKETNCIGSLVVFWDRKFVTVRDIAHESMHVSQYLWKHIGEDNIGEEAEAFLVGWIAKCCEDVKNWKNGQDGK